MMNYEIFKEVVKEKFMDYRLRFISMTCIRSIRTVVILRCHIIDKCTSP